MYNREIPNIQVAKTQYMNDTIYMGSASADLSCWVGYFLNDNPAEVITDAQFIVGIQHSSSGHAGFSASQEQANAYHYLVENQVEIKQAIVQAMKDKFPSLLEDEYSSYDLSYFPKLSDLTPEFDFKNYIGPTSVNIENDVKDNFAYITWHFNCLWDTEHGFEVITHKSRVLDFGPEADRFKINEDNGSAEEVNKRFDAHVHQVKQKKSWWKFW
jgi:hypothetical protein